MLGSPHAPYRQQNTPQDAQKHRPARPQRATWRIVLPPYGEPLSDASTPAADVFRILLDTPHDKSSPCPMTMTPVLPGRKLVASRTARCFLPPSPLARFAHFKACVPWVMAPPAGKAAATSTVSANSGSEAPRVLALFVRSSMRWGHCVVQATPSAINSLYVLGIAPSATAARSHATHAFIASGARAARSFILPRLVLS